jgi:hypothetical protein
MTTNNKEDSDTDKWKTFGINLGMALGSLIFSIFIGTYIIYLSKLADSGILDFFEPFVPKTITVLQSGNCKWETSFTEFDTNTDKSGFLRWIELNTSDEQKSQNNIIKNYICELFNETIRWQFWVMGSLSHL